MNDADPIASAPNGGTVEVIDGRTFIRVPDFQTTGKPTEPVVGVTYTGPNGGRYMVNRSGRKVYLPR
jgi:hypothetical protein